MSRNRISRLGAVGVILVAALSVMLVCGALAAHPKAGKPYKGFVAGMSFNGGAATASGTWRTLPAPPPRLTPLLSQGAAWTGHAFVLFGRIQPHPPASKDVALAYTPSTGAWRTLHPFSGPPGNFQGSYRALWTGRQMLIFQPQDTQAYTPATGRWSRLRQEPAGGGEDGLVAWAGHELIDWGGGCCGDALATGAALDPSTGRWRLLPVAPLAPSNSPVGVWTGHALLVFVTGLDPEGHQYPATLARAAAYNPATNTWRRITPIPSPRRGEALVWDGHEVLAVGGYRATGISAQPILLASTLAYTPASNRWHILAAMPAGRAQFAVVWTGRHLLVWGGTRAASSLATATGLSYNPVGNRWSALPAAPLRPTLVPIAVWTGRSMLIWTGSSGASFTPTAR